MAYGFKIIAEGDYACFTRPEMKVERVSYDVPPPGALEGMLKSIYWKPAIRYIIDRIVVFNPINFANIRRNEVKEKVLLSKIKAQMSGKQSDPCIYTSEARSQRASMVLKNVKYGVEFHFGLTGLRSEREEDPIGKHMHIIRKRLEKGQFFRIPCLGCSEFPVKKIYLVDDFEASDIDASVVAAGDVDLGYMSYRVAYMDCGKPLNDDFEHPVYSDKASTIYYRPHMVRGVIDVARYREAKKC